MQNTLQTVDSTVDNNYLFQLLKKKPDSSSNKHMIKFYKTPILIRCVFYNYSINNCVISRIDTGSKKITELVVKIFFLIFNFHIFNIFIFDFKVK